ncbi:hypothetical protein BGZ97_005624 [Linnemannia gamsii]|uniref:Uncharacterized protein n=1 Tax=Linnemannia gamsii TaxID=64522 RepID=A0A9P6RH83_9FUNG|nr:hypothetical protein BGZ97_005624 [Linnemannia gamsii]
MKFITSIAVAAIAIATVSTQSIAINTNVKIDANQAPGKYSLEFGTKPVSYSPIFDIVNPAAQTPATTPAKQPETPTPVQQQKGTNGAGALAADSLVAAAGAAVAALQFIL